MDCGGQKRNYQRKTPCANERNAGYEKILSKDANLGIFLLGHQYGVIHGRR